MRPEYKNFLLGMRSKLTVSFSASSIEVSITISWLEVVSVLLRFYPKLTSPTCDAYAIIFLYYTVYHPKLFAGLHRSLIQSWSSCLYYFLSQFQPENIRYSIFVPLGNWRKLPADKKLLHAMAFYKFWTDVDDYSVVNLLYSELNWHRLY